jgi:hypothetical protein
VGSAVIARTCSTVGLVTMGIPLTLWFTASDQATPTVEAARKQERAGPAAEETMLFRK